MTQDLGYLTDVDVGCHLANHCSQISHLIFLPNHHVSRDTSLMLTILLSLQRKTKGAWKRPSNYFLEGELIAAFPAMPAALSGCLRNLHCSSVTHPTPGHHEYRLTSPIVSECIEFL
jgi:hypothetical protein